MDPYERSENATEFNLLFGLLLNAQQGFAYKQAVENQSVPYITETVKASLLGGKLTKTTSARETEEEVYIAHVVYAKN